MAKKSIFEGESLMLLLHPVFLLATIAHLIGYGAKRTWQAVTGARRPDIVVDDAQAEQGSLTFAEAQEGALSPPTDQGAGLAVQDD